MSGVDKMKMLMSGQRHIIIGWMRLSVVKVEVVQLLALMTIDLVA